MSGISKTRKPPSYYIEWGYVQGRAFTLNFLALGTMLLFYRIGTNIGQMTFGEHPTALFMCRVAFVALAYYAIDWVLKIVLTDASSVAKQNSELFDVTGHKIEVVQQDTKGVWKVAIAALSITTLISLASNFFVSDELSGQSHLVTYQNQLLSRMATDSTFKREALQLLSQSGDKQTALTTAAEKRKSTLLAEAITSGSASWQDDYELHKDNPKAWFWVCQECPSGYKRYRERIKTAMAEGDKLVASASGYSELMASSLSPTLNQSVMADSSLIELKETVLSLEQQRQDKRFYLNLVLVLMTIAGAAIALLLTSLLRKHRQIKGQLINDNPARFMMVFSDIMNRSKRFASDVLYTVTFHVHESMLSKGWLKSYTIEDTHITESLHATVQMQKRCLHCDEKLVGKRSDSKYCDDQCRSNYHANRRKKKSA